MVGLPGGYRGVSSVVGVVLMVAVVVGLAGLVSVFVFDEIPTEREPLAEISVEEAEVKIDEENGEVEEIDLSLFHRVGSTIDGDDTYTSITIEDDLGNLITERIELSEWLQDQESWSVGQEINKTITEQYFDEIEGEPVEVEVWVVHTPTGNTIDVKESTITIEWVEEEDLEEFTLTLSVDPDENVTGTPPDVTAEWDDEKLQIDQGETEEITVEENTEVVLTQTNRSGQLDWTGDIPEDSEDEDEIEILMDADKEIVAERKN